MVLVFRFSSTDGIVNSVDASCVPSAAYLENLPGSTIHSQSISEDMPFVQIVEGMRDTLRAPSSTVTDNVTWQVFAQAEDLLACGANSLRSGHRGSRIGLSAW
jgi:hypothetical protein